MGGVNFGELEFYSGGFNLPEGDHCLFFDVRMHAGTKQDGTPAGPERLGIMLHAYSIGPDGTLKSDEAVEKFLSMGTKAHQTYCPDPDSADANGWCKEVSLVPGGPGQQPNNQTNWGLFLKSLYDCAMPKGTFTNSLTTIDGVWVHTQNVPEPEDRKGFGAATGEVEQQVRKAGTIPIVTAILENGKPWEGGGGLKAAAAPVAGPKPKVAAGPKPGPKAAPKAGPRPVAPAPVAAVETGEAMDDDAVRAAALNGIAEVLGAAPKGVLKLVLRTGTFTKIKEKEGEEMAKQVAESIFADDTVLAGLLGEVGYKIAGASISPL